MPDSPRGRAGFGYGALDAQLGYPPLYRLTRSYTHPYVAGYVAGYRAHNEKG